MQIGSELMRLPSACDLLVLAAHPVELTPLRAQWGGALAGECGGAFVATAAVGVGLWASAAGTAATLRACAAPAVLLTGSYGFLPGLQGALLEILVPDHCFLLDGGLLRGDSALPEFVPTSLAFDPALVSGLRGLEPQALSAPLGTGLAITTSAQAANAYAAALNAGDVQQCRGENLEALGVAEACRAHRTRLASVMVATNEVGPQGRAQWLAHHRAAAERAMAVVQAYVHAGMPGVAT